jgi:adenine-specific DNA-methyltransferase
MENQMTQHDPQLRELILAHVPADGSSIGNIKLQKALAEAADFDFDDQDYLRVRDALIVEGVLGKGQGRGGSVFLVEIESFDLSSQAVDPEEPAPAKKSAKATVTKAGVTRGKISEEVQVVSYRHLDKRKNNPEVGMVTPASDPDAGKTRWAYDPHLDPTLNFDSQRARIEQLIDDALVSGDTDQMRQVLEELKHTQSPYLNWAGKAERTSFEVDTVSLHVHERIDPASILSAVRKAMKREGKSKGVEQAIQPGLFDAPFENLPLRDAIDFYRHERGWANRLVAGDSLLVMNSLLQKESMAGRIQMFYFDPPYGIKYGSNFQPFVGKRDVKDRSDADLTQEPEMIKAFRDTWELGIHSYLTYLRDRLLLARELLHESGSVFVQISDENIHHVREIMDEIFGAENFISIITYVTTSGIPGNSLSRQGDFIVWYAKQKSALKYRQLYTSKSIGDDGSGEYRWLRLLDGSTRSMTSEEMKGNQAIPMGSRPFRYGPVTSSGAPSEPTPFELNGRVFNPSANNHWKTTLIGLERVKRAGLMLERANSFSYFLFLDSFPVQPIANLWQDTKWGFDAGEKAYVVQTNEKIIERCLLMTTDPGDLVFDPTCGSGTTAFVAEKWGRRWITCDTSRVAMTLAKQRLMTASFDYFELKYPHEGLKGGFIYKTVPHVTLKSIANNPDIDSIYARMHPTIENILESLNAELHHNPPRKEFAITEGVRKGSRLNFAKGDSLLEWEVPFGAPENWPELALGLHDKFLHARQHMQRQMDASIAAHADQEVLYDQPAITRSRLRITGPFTVEAVPFPSVQSLDDAHDPDEADASIARTGESGRQHQWIDELLKTGIRGKGGQMLKFADLESLPFDNNMRHLHAVGYLDSGERMVVSFGPEHAALEQRQVEMALHEAERLRPAPQFVLFTAFTFDPEAAKDIDETRWPGVTLLKAQMNTDLLTDDLKKARSSNQSFWLMGQPEVEVRALKEGRYQVEVHGFDYFDTVKGELVSGGKGKIAMWALDTDYDERSLFPHQVFFPMAGKGEGWDKLKKSIRAELDEDRLHQFHGTVSLPFEAGKNLKIAVKIIDDRGIESLKVVSLS